MEKRAKPRRVKKRCEKCGKTSMALPRERTCKQPVGLLKTYCCWGALRLVPKPPAPKKRPQEVAAAKLRHAEKMIALTNRRLVRLTTALRGWRSKAAYYATRASMTDADLVAEREREKQKEQERAARRARRAIDLAMAGEGK